MTNQAAERLRRYVEGEIAYLEQIDRTPFGEGSLCAFKRVQPYLGSIEHLPDDGEAIDEAWLAVTGWKKGGLCMWLGEYLTWSASRGIYVGMYPQSHIRTRGQLRLLLRALGVEGEGK